MTELDEHQVSKFLIENNFNLTALEFFCENYELHGTAIEELSGFFEDSANFLMFEDMKSVSEISSTMSESSPAITNDAIRIKDDRIAVLEHDLKVLRDSLDEAKSRLKEKQSDTVATMQSPPTNFSGPSEADDELILNILISRYLQNRGLRLSLVAFNNETGAARHSDKVHVPSDVELIHLLRSFRLIENSPQMAEELSKLKEEKEQLKINNAQLTQDLAYSKQQIADLTNKMKEQADQKATEKDNAVAPVISGTSEPPTVTLLDTIFSDMMQLSNAMDTSERKRIIKPLQSIIRFHPLQEKRIQCISLLFNMWEDPSEEQRELIISALVECCDKPENVQSEIIPVISQLLASTKPNMLCLLSTAVGVFAPLCEMQIRSSLLFSIIRQLAEHSNCIVRAQVAKDGGILIKSFYKDNDATDKLQDLIDLCKKLLFDSDAGVQTATINHLVPAILQFLQSRQNIGKGFYDYWLKQALTFGKTGSSALAALRFKLCCKALECAMKAIIPVIPQPGQQLVAEGANLTDESVIIPKAELDWLIQTLVPQLPLFGPLLFVQINIKKEVDSFVSSVCKQVGTQFNSEHIIPVFLTSIEKSDPDTKQQTTTLFLSAVSSASDNETFFTQSRNFFTYATNELRSFRSRDTQEFIAPSFALLSAREVEKRPLIFKLIDELARSSRAAIRTSAIAILSEILPTLEQSDIEKSVMPVITRLSTDPDETLQLEVVNCAGVIARFSTLSEVVQNIETLFTDWLKGKISLRLQTIRVFAVIVSDIDLQFRDDFIIPKLQEAAVSAQEWTEPGAKDQALMVMLHMIYSLTDVPDELVNSSIIPVLQAISRCEICTQDPKFQELVVRYAPKDEKKESGFSKLFG